MKYCTKLVNLLRIIWLCQRFKSKEIFPFTEKFHNNVCLGTVCRGKGSLCGARTSSWYFCQERAEPKVGPTSDEGDKKQDVPLIKLEGMRLTHWKMKHACELREWRLQDYDLVGCNCWIRCGTAEKSRSRLKLANLHCASFFVQGSTFCETLS